MNKQVREIIVKRKIKQQRAKRHQIAIRETLKLLETIT